MKKNMYGFTHNAALVVLGVVVATVIAGAGINVYKQRNSSSAKAASGYVTVISYRPTSTSIMQVSACKYVKTFGGITKAQLRLHGYNTYPKITNVTARILRGANQVDYTVFMPPLNVTTYDTRSYDLNLEASQPNTDVLSVSFGITRIYKVANLPLCPW